MYYRPIHLFLHRILTLLLYCVRLSRLLNEYVMLSHVNTINYDFLIIWQGLTFLECPVHSYSIWQPAPIRISHDARCF